MSEGGRERKRGGGERKGSNRSCRNVEWRFPIMDVYTHIPTEHSKLRHHYTHTHTDVVSPEKVYTIRTLSSCISLAIMTLGEISQATV